MLLYAAIQLVCVATVPALATSERPLAEAATAMVGPWGGIAMSLGAVVSCLGVFGAVMTPGTRQMYALAESQQLPGVLARLHPAYHTPHWSILVTGLADGEPLPDPRLVVSVPDTTNIALDASGDSLVAKRSGRGDVVVALVSSLTTGVPPDTVFSIRVTGAPPP